MPKNIYMNAGLSLSEDLAASGSASISGDVTGKNITTENLDIKKTLSGADNDLINFYKDPNENPVAYIWLNTAPGTSPDMLRLGSGSGRTSWTIGLRDKITGHQTNQLSYGFNGVDQESLVGINYDDIAGFNNPNLNSLLRIQKGGTTNSQLLYTKDGVLSVGNSNTVVENNGGYRLDINGDGLFRGKVTANGDLLVDGNIDLGRGSGGNDPVLTIQRDTGPLLSFFNSTPVVQQSAPTDSLAEVITALRAYGLLTTP